MRLAVVADIHGNLGALEAVLADLKTQAPDLVVDLGDCLSGPLQPRATADRLMDLGWLTLRGNHERALLETPVAAMGASDRFTHAELDQRHLDWLATMPTMANVLEGIVAFHAAPDDDTFYLVDRLTDQGVVTRDADEIDDRLGGLDARLALFGHTHVPRLLLLPSGRTVLNPGSVGLPAYDDDTPISHVMCAGSPHARYAIVDIAGDRFTVTNRCIVYDWEAAAALALRNGRPDWAAALGTGLLAWPGA